MFVDNYTNPSDTTQASPTTAVTSAARTARYQGRDHEDRQPATSSGSSSSPTRTATTSRSRPATACGARTCATTTATAQITQPRRRRPQPQLPARSGTTTTRAPRTTRRARPTAARARRPSPRRRRWTACSKRVGFEFQINYHSAAELLLYPIGWQVRRRTRPTTRSTAPCRARTTTRPSRARATGAPDFYDPDVAAELYTTNGETTDHALRQATARSAWTPEMDVADPERGGGDSVFEFQDAEDDLEQAFEKNIPFALDVAKSADGPGQPGRRTSATRRPTSRSRPFDDLLRRPAGRAGQRQARARQGHACTTAINGGAEQTAPTKEWNGGERYGGDSDIYYHRLRGTVKGAKPGDKVARVVRAGGGKRSQSFTYAVAQRHRQPRADHGGRGLLGRHERARPTRTTPARTTSSYYTDALHGQRRSSYDVCDVDARGRTAPDPLGVLSHYKAVIWYTGNDLLVREPGAPGGTGTSKLAQTTRSSTSATTSTRAASCSTRARTPASAQLTGSRSTPPASRRTARRTPSAGRG